MTRSRQRIMWHHNATLGLGVNVYDPLVLSVALNLNLGKHSPGVTAWLGIRVVTV